MPVIVARWPNGTFSVVRAPVGFSMTELFWELDTEADPTDASLFLLKQAGDGWSHMTFDWGHKDFEKVDGEDFIRFTPNAGELDAHAGRLKKIKWPRGILRQAYRYAFGDQWKESPQIAKISAEELSAMPAEPVNTFSVEDVRSMKPFCGVYFAYESDGSCHYVGESINVPNRITGSRPEIGSRRIGVIRCERHERKRIESFYIGLLDPPGNASSTTRMIEREGAK